MSKNTYPRKIIVLLMILLITQKTTSISRPMNTRILYTSSSGANGAGTYVNRRIVV